MKVLESVDPRTGQHFGRGVDETSAQDLDAAIAASTHASKAWSRLTPAVRSGALQAAADSLDAATSSLVALADQETALGSARLEGELRRATHQLGVFADLARFRDSLGLVVQPAVVASPPVGHPDIRRRLLPLGPVAVYAASNFPFAFGVGGADTAAALAAGCSVVVKAHPAHPQLSQELARVLGTAMSEAGAPHGVLQVVHGMRAGLDLVTHPDIRAAAFTGSQSGGRALFDRAVGRPDPIPFYGELGSVNPVVVTPGASAEEDSSFVGELIASLTGSGGQLCTKPGVVLVPRTTGSLTGKIMEAVRSSSSHIMLSASIAERCSQVLGELQALGRVDLVLGEHPGGGGGFRVRTALVRTSAANALEQPGLVRTECFGPVAVLVEYDSEQEMIAVLRLLEGCLAAAVYGQEDEAVSKTVIDLLEHIAGRIVWRGMTTGVIMCAAQHHGGPYPATTSPLHTSVGTASIYRFLRPVAYQSMPRSLLPSALLG
jgi:NADP-dependent aldehyde dehydrogenase